VGKVYGGFVKRGMNGRLRFAVEQGRIKNVDVQFAVTINY